MKKKYVWKLSAVVTAVALTVWGLFPLFSEEENSAVFSQGAEYTVSKELKTDYSYDMPDNGADSAIVIDADSGSVLFQKNADMIRGMASTTKIMTALVAIENCNPEAEFKIPKEAVGVEGSSVYLLEGEPLTLEELLYCLLLESGNDAAAAIAISVGGSIEGFANMMNARASELELEHTHFTNPHGLSDYEHHTTARELAVITAEALKYPLFREIAGTKSHKVRYDGVEGGRSLSNHNKMLSGYEGCIGVKTGYTERDGKCLVSAAQRDGLTLIAVSLHDSAPTVTHTALLNAGFGNFCRKEIVKSGEITATVPIKNGEKDFTTLCNIEDISVCLPKNAVFEIELISSQQITAPVPEGEIFGKARVTCEGKEVYIINLETTEEIKEREKSFWEKLFGK